MGIAGAVAVISIESITEATVGSASGAPTLVNQGAVAIPPLGAKTPQDVTILATDAASLQQVVGGFAGGAGAVGAAIAVGHIRNRTVALVGPETRISALGVVGVVAESVRDIDATVISGTGGLVSISGSVGVFGIGGPIDPRASTEFTNDPGSGSVLGSVLAGIDTDRPLLLSGASFSFDPVAATDPVTDTIDLGVVPGVATGDRVTYLTDAAGGAPVGGLTAGAAYFVRVDGTRVSLHASAADAVADTGRLQLSPAGTGTHRLVVTEDTAAQSADAVDVPAPDVAGAIDPGASNAGAITAAIIADADPARRVEIVAVQGVTVRAVQRYDLQLLTGSFDDRRDLPRSRRLARRRRRSDDRGRRGVGAGPLAAGSDRRRRA